MYRSYKYNYSQSKIQTKILILHYRMELKYYVKYIYIFCLKKKLILILLKNIYTLIIQNRSIRLTLSYL